MTKFLIVGETSIDKTKLIDILLDKSSNLSVSLLFTTNLENISDTLLYIALFALLFF